jgi:hypothetical protein
MAKDIGKLAEAGKRYLLERLDAIAEYLPFLKDNHRGSKYQAPSGNKQGYPLQISELITREELMEHIQEEHSEELH